MVGVLATGKTLPCELRQNEISLKKFLLNSLQNMEECRTLKAYM